MVSRTEQKNIEWLINKNNILYEMKLENNILFYYL